MNRSTYRPDPLSVFFVETAEVALANRRDLSLIDLSSFACMQRRGLRFAFAFDKHFDE